MVLMQASKNSLIGNSSFSEKKKVAQEFRVHPDERSSRRVEVGSETD
jgi:hypothetical protein